ncbi:UNVERIFIED_CONTAM: hypothetical protein HDU68_005379 [Siphonaria sp. JEL0065]|nr:hypothetical protein HDU68_005379 [Siphonaria sp. JEL0065]
MLAAIRKKLASAPAAGTALTTLKQLTGIVSELSIQDPKAHVLVVNKLVPPITDNTHLPEINAIADLLLELDLLVDHSDPAHLAELVSALPISLSSPVNQPDDTTVRWFSVRDTTLATRVTPWSSGLVSWESVQVTQTWGRVVGNLTTQVINEFDPNNDGTLSEIQIEKASGFLYAVFDVLEKNNGFFGYEQSVSGKELYDDPAWSNTWGLFWQGWFDGFKDEGTLGLATLLVKVATTEDPASPGTSTPFVLWNLVAAFNYMSYLDGNDRIARNPFRNPDVARNLTENFALVFKAKYLSKTGKSCISLQDHESFDAFFKFVVEFLIHSCPNPYDQAAMMVPFLKSVDRPPPGLAGKFITSVWMAVKGHVDIKFPLEDNEHEPRYGTIEDVRLFFGTVAEEYYGWAAFSDELNAFIEAMYEVWGSRRMEEVVNDAFAI